MIENADRQKQNGKRTVPGHWRSGVAFFCAPLFWPNVFSRITELTTAGSKPLVSIVTVSQMWILPDCDASRTIVRKKNLLLDS